MAGGAFDVAAASPLRGFTAIQSALAALQAPAKMDQLLGERSPVRSLEKSLAGLRLPELASVITPVGSGIVQGAAGTGALASIAGVKSVASQVANFGGLAMAAQRRLHESMPRMASIPDGVLRSLEAWRQQTERFTRAYLSRLDELDTAISLGLPAFTARHGWVIPIHAETLAHLEQVAGLQDSSPRVVERWMLEAYRPGSRRFQRAVRDLKSSAVGERHGRAVEQGLRALRREDYYAAVSTLLPLVEGGIVEALWLESPRGDRKSRVLDDFGELQAAAGSIMVDLLGAVIVPSATHSMFSSVTLGDVRDLPGSRRLNRHAILHGAANRYGTRAHALRTLLTLCAVAEIPLHKARPKRATG